jgi:hypothetical protein
MARRNRNESRRTPIDTRPSYRSPVADALDNRVPGPVGLPTNTLYNRETNRSPVLRAPTRLLPASNPASPLALARSPEIAGAAPPTPQQQAALRDSPNTMSPTTLPSTETRKPFVQLPVRAPARSTAPFSTANNLTRRADSRSRQDTKPSTLTTRSDPLHCNKRPDSRSKGGSGRAFVPWKAKKC